MLASVAWAPAGMAAMTAAANTASVALERLASSISMMGMSSRIG